MKRLHVHVSVAELDASIRFYSELSQRNRWFARTTTQSGCWTIPG